RERTPLYRAVRNGISLQAVARWAATDPELLHAGGLPGSSRIGDAGDAAFGRGAVGRGALRVPARWPMATLRDARRAIVRYNVAGSTGRTDARSTPAFRRAPQCGGALRLSIAAPGEPRDRAWHYTLAGSH